MKKLSITVTLLLLSVVTAAQQTQAPAHKASPADQSSFQEANKRLTDARIAAELARRELDAAFEHLGSVINNIRAENAWPESKFEASLDKDGVLVFTEKRPASASSSAKP